MLKASYSETDITPPVGKLIAGFGVRKSTGVHSPLMAKAIALSDGKTTLCLCVCDLAVVHREDVDRIRAKVMEQVPSVEASAILIGSTHTHASGESCYRYGGTPGDSWVPEMNQKTAEAIIGALQGLKPATASVNQVDAPYNFNRRAIGENGKANLLCNYEAGVTEGVTDPTMTVLRFDQEGGDTILWVHWAAHALTLGSKNLLFSADYPAAMTEFVQGNWEAGRWQDGHWRKSVKVVFSNGAAGNQHPKWCVREDSSALEKVGQLLGEKVLEASKKATPIEDTALHLKNAMLSFTNRADSNLTVEAEISYLQIDSIIMGFWPGEPYMEFQLRLKEALKDRIALLMGYTNGSLCYIPPLEAFPYGGYGVDFFPPNDREPPKFSRTILPKGAGEKMFDALLELYKQ